MAEVSPGDTFGSWKVVSKAETPRSGASWNCVCKCKTKRVVRGIDLIGGKTKSCGCGKAANTKKVYAERAIGKRFGRLVVERVLETDETRGLLVQCHCDCGRKYRVHMRTLRANSVKSCGCYALECYECWRGQTRANYKQPFKMPTVVKTSALQRKLASRM